MVKGPNYLGIVKPVSSLGLWPKQPSPFPAEGNVVGGGHPDHAK
jgi:hypothetical protein